MDLAQPDPRWPITRKAERLHVHGLLAAVSHTRDLCAPCAANAYLYGCVTASRILILSPVSKGMRGDQPVDDSGFDAVVRRLTNHFSRRRSLAMLAALGLGASLLTNDVDAKKRRKNKKRKKKNKPQPPPTCTGCTDCETCVNGACQPVANETACGTGDVCLNGACAERCAGVHGPCSGGDYSCQGRASDNFQTVCVVRSGQPFCERPVCADDAACAAGEACVTTSMCSGGEFRNICAAVA